MLMFVPKSGMNNLGTMMTVTMWIMPKILSVTVQKTLPVKVNI